MSYQPMFPHLLGMSAVQPPKPAVPPVALPDWGVYGFNGPTPVLGKPDSTGFMAESVTAPADMPWYRANGMLDQRDPKTGMVDQGWGGLALGGVNSLVNLWMGMENLGLAKDQLAFSKESWAKNFENQRRLTNSQLEDRQRARIASNPGAYESVGSYMSRNGV